MLSERSPPRAPTLPEDTLIVVFGADVERLEVTMTTIMQIRTHLQCECGEWYSFIEDITDDDEQPPCITTCPNCGKVTDWTNDDDNSLGDTP